MKQFWSIFFLAACISSCAQKTLDISKSRKESLYRFELPGTMLLKTVLLREDGSFEYRSLDDKTTFFASGRWVQNADTLVLSNEINKDDLPIEVSAKPNLKSDSLRINWVRNTAADILEDAVIYYNNDMVKSCMPAFDECKFSGQTIFSLKVVFPQGESKWIKLEPISLGEINITVPFSIEMNNYIFDQNFKFVVKKSSIYEIFKDSLTNKIKKTEFKLYK